ncbi:MAG: hypothetical protein KAT81_04560 [Syntrophobacterales bacterium]|nr:hypothetical protein [Syntrophobacterales bacterium]
MKEKIIKSSIGITVAIFLLFSSGLRLPFLDKTTDVYFREAISKAGIAYATCRAINASVSIIKDSSLQLEPAGVGISLAVGQALDPIDDMTERLSDVLVTAIASLGIQKLIYEMSVSLVPPVLSILLLLLSALVWFKNERIQHFQKFIIRFSVIIIIARFCLPVSSVANEFIHQHFFAKQISETRETLALGTADLDKLTEYSLPEVDGVLGTISNSSSFLKRKSIELKDALVTTASNMESIVENLLTLTFLYVGIFLIQVIILPLLVFWIFVKVANSLFLTNIPTALHHSRSLKSENVQQIKPVDG